VALLAQFLVCFGTAIGRTAHYAVEASRHFGNEFVVLVGSSSKGRKGSSWDHVERVNGQGQPALHRRLHRPTRRASPAPRSAPLSRNQKAREIDRALTALVEARRLERGEMRTGGVGRPAVVWRPICAAQAA
jgi:hypothetical protein